MSKAQYNLDRKTAKISALSSGNVSKYEFSTGKDLLTEKNFLEKAATMKRFEYSPSSKELKKRTKVCETQYQSFDKVFNNDGKEVPVKIKKEVLLTTDESSLFYSNKCSFIEFKNFRKYMDNSLVSRYNNYLASFKQPLEEFKKITPRKLKTKAKKRTVYINGKKLYSKLQSIYYDDYSGIIDKEKEYMGGKYNPKNLLLKGQRFTESKKEEKSKSLAEETMKE